MRNIIALTALLVCAGAWAQDAGEPAEAIKVLGFTLDVPVPPGALPESAEPVAWTDDGAYTVYNAVHRWCETYLLAVAHREHGVFYVRCKYGGDREWERRLRMRYGEPAYKPTTSGDRHHIFLPDEFAFVRVDNDSSHWLSLRGPVVFDRPKKPKKSNDCDDLLPDSFDDFSECLVYPGKLLGSVGDALDKAWEIVEKTQDQRVARQSEGEDF